LREVNHRVHNNLAAIISLLILEQGRAGVDNQATYQAIMQDLINRIHGLAAVHRLLSAAGWSPLLLSELTGQVINSALQIIPLDKNVSVDVSSSTVRVAPKEANNLALAINELVTNSAKYAWPTCQTGHISVHIDQVDDWVIFEFRDDGVGYPEEVLHLKHHNIGLELLQTLIGHGLRGEITLSNDNGAIAAIRFPAIV
jgi:two-component sensor histidine kinase